MRVPGGRKLFEVLAEMQQGETECDKHNLFYAHVFSNENNFAHLQRNEMSVSTSRRQRLIYIKFAVHFIMFMICFRLNWMFTPCHFRNTVPKWAKIIPYLRIKNLKNHTLSRGTYLYNSYME